MKRGNYSHDGRMYHAARCTDTGAWSVQCIKTGATGHAQRIGDACAQARTRADRASAPTWRI